MDLGVSSFSLLTLVFLLLQLCTRVSEQATGEYLSGLLTDETCSLYCTVPHHCLSIEDDTNAPGVNNWIILNMPTLKSIQKPSLKLFLDYTGIHLRGPMCRYAQPDCDFTDEYCIDTCKPPGYTCKTYKNIALGKPVRASSQHRLFKNPARNIVDGNPATFFLSNRGTLEWIRVDLLDVYNIPFVTLTNRKCFRSFHCRQLKGLSIRIGNFGIRKRYSNQLCVDDIYQKRVVKKNYYCRNGPIKGRYVFVMMNLAGFRRVRGFLGFSEIRVVSL